MQGMEVWVQLDLRVQRGFGIRVVGIEVRGEGCGVAGGAAVGLEDGVGGRGEREEARGKRFGGAWDAVKGVVRAWGRGVGFCGGLGEAAVGSFGGAGGMLGSEGLGFMWGATVRAGVDRVWGAAGFGVSRGFGTV